MYLLVILAIGALIVLHALIPEDFLVDSTSVALLTVLIVVIAIPYLPVITRYVEELTIMGIRFKFREVIQRAEEQLEVVTSEAERKRQSEAEMTEAIRKMKGRAPVEREAKPKAATGWPGFVPIDDHLYRLVDDDPRLAVAGLGIAVEQVLREAPGQRGIDQAEPSPRRMRVASLPEVVRALERSQIVTRDQAVLLLQLVELRNLAVHGREIAKEDAYRFFSIVERLNDSVSLGYSLHVHPNED